MSAPMDDATLLALFAGDHGRTWTGPNGLMRRAAEEIWRLRAEVAELKRAAAPELLDCLQWAAKQIGILSEYIETPDALAKFDECRAAIAKATGAA